MRNPVFPLLDRILDGQLEDMLRSWRSEGETYAEIAFLLRTEHDVKVSTSMVLRWCNDLGIEAKAEAAS